MKPRVACSVILSGWLILLPGQMAAARQTIGGATNAQTGAGTTGEVGPGSRAGRRASTGLDQPAQRRIELFITGAVALSDGAPVPPGVVIERVCLGRVTKEGYVDTGGSFAFQLGSNSDTIEDASIGGQPSSWDSAGRIKGPLSDNPGRFVSALGACELRAQLGGFRSSVASLNVSQVFGHVDVGTIVLSPAKGVSGSTVSLTDLLATKKDESALARAEKAIREAQWDHAEKHLKIALDESPQYVTARLRLGQVLHAMCRIDDARAALAGAIAVDPKYSSDALEAEMITSRLRRLEMSR